MASTSTDADTCVVSTPSRRSLPSVLASRNQVSGLSSSATGCPWAPVPLATAATTGSQASAGTCQAWAPWVK